MVYAAPGLGKTWYALSVAFAVASGGNYLGWNAPEPAKVLYVDGEMDTWDMQRRIAAMAGSATSAERKAASLNFRGWQATDQPVNEAMPDLATEEGQAQFLKLSGGASLVVLDNLTTLMGTGDENEVAWWASMQATLLELRKRGTAVLLVHHANKAGGDRGTSAKRVILNIVQKLETPTRPVGDGASFLLTWEKNRSVAAHAAQPVVASLTEEPDGTLKWAYETCGPRVLEFLRLVTSGQHETLGSVARAMDVSPSRVTALKQTALDLGLTTPAKLALALKGARITAADDNECADLPPDF